MGPDFPMSWSRRLNIMKLWVILLRVWLGRINWFGDRVWGGSGESWVIFEILTCADILVGHCLIHSSPLARPVRTSGSTGSNETMCQNGRFEPAVHTRAGSGWMGNGVGTRSAKLSAHLALQNSRNINFLVIFSIFHFGGSESNKSRWSRHFSKQSIPGLFY